MPKFKSWHDREKKAIARDLAQPLKVCKSTCWLAGAEMVDFLDAMFVKKVLDPKGRHVVVEKDAEIAKVIQNRMTEYRLAGPECKLFQGGLHNYRTSRPLDYLGADFCGGLTEKTARWVQYDLKLADEAQVVFNFCYPLRGNPFMKECIHLIKTNPVLKEMFKREKQELSRDDNKIAAYCVVLRCILRDYKFRFYERPTYYADEVTPMVYYPLNQFEKRSKNHPPDIIDMIEKEREKIDPNIGITDLLIQADNPIIKYQAFRRLRGHLKAQRQNGKNPVQVLAGIRASLTRKGKKNLLDNFHMALKVREITDSLNPPVGNRTVFSGGIETNIPSAGFDTRYSSRAASHERV